LLSYSNCKAFLRFLYKNLIDFRGTNYRLTTKRLGVLLLALVIFAPIEIIVWTGFILDELFFPTYHDIKINQPVFIIGNPRSGTTFLQRLLARDSGNFLSMRTWEIFGSPSILTRRLMRGAARFGQFIGIPVNRRIRKMEQLWKDDDRIHRFRLRAPEEDEYLFVHNFSTLKIWSFASMEDEADPYIYYDQKISQQDKIRNMSYYERCIQRHYHYHGVPNKNYLSKNPNFSPAINTLLEKFPDAKFIYLIRNPMQAVPSHISLKEREWQMLGSPLKKYACADFIIKSSEHWYNYPLKRLKELPEDQAIIVKFDDLVQDAEKTILRVYRQFGFSMTKEFKSVLQHEAKQARNHQSQHLYTLSEMGINKQEMIDRFGSVMNEYDFGPEY
jgi:omega-hydroxy-beta-dihydromenaquinone-9 sulfotransferase